MKSFIELQKLPKSCETGQRRSKGFVTTLVILSVVAGGLLAGVNVLANAVKETPVLVVPGAGHAVHYSHADVLVRQTGALTFT